MSEAAVSLRGLLWRFRSGWCAESRLTAAISRRLARIADRALELERQDEVLWRVAGETRAGCDAARAAVLRALDTRDFETAVGSLRRAERLLDDLEAAVAAHLQLESVGESWRSFLVEHDLDGLQGAATLRIARRLAALGRELLAGGEWRRAALVSGILERYAASLARDRQGGVPPETAAYIAELSGVEPETARRLERLCDAGLGELAVRLADDLQARLRSAEERIVPATLSTDDLTARASKVAALIAGAGRAASEDVTTS